MLKKLKRESSFPLYRELNIKPIQHLFVYKVLSLFFIRSGNVGNDNKHYITRYVRSNNFRLPKVNKTIFRHSFQYLGPKFFNQIPLNIKNILNFKKFCQQTIIWLNEQQDINHLTSVMS